MRVVTVDERVGEKKTRSQHTTRQARKYKATYLKKDEKRVIILIFPREQADAKSTCGRAKSPHGRVP